MNPLFDAFAGALGLIASGDRALLQIVLLSLGVSLAAVVLATLIGLPLGAAVAVARFPGRQAVLVVMNALMGLPPVVVGLVVYLLLSRAGPLGSLGLLFTPPAMVFAQTLLIFPIIAALARQAVEDAWVEYEEQLRSLQVPVRLIWGVADQLMPLDYAQRMIAVLPDVALIPIERCGHIPQQEAPERFRTALDQALASAPGATK